MASTINAKNTSTGVVITPDASGQLELQTADTTRMTITSGGNVGIGTTSPTAYGTGYTTLDVNGSTQGTIQCEVGGTPQALIYANSTEGGTGTLTNTPFRFVTNNSERMRITSNGGISFGSSGTAYGTSGQVLQSNGNAAPTWVDSRGMTLLGTLTTTSGATQTLSGLNLTTYKTLVIYVNNVSMSASAQIRLNSIAITQGTGASGNSVWGACFVDLSIGTFAAISSATVSSTGTLSNTGVTNNGNCGVTSAATSLVFSPSAGSFDAGTITVYGVS